MYDEEDLLPLSAIQHILFCERQCALIHIEQAWTENQFTAEGRIIHERADSYGGESRGKVRLAFSLFLRSLQLGLSGKADVVEFRMDDGGRWRPFPVEHKRGRPKKQNYDRAQLCAQAMCLEEMLECSIPAGALFYGKTRRRQNVDFDKELRAEVREAAIRLHELIKSGRTPEPIHDARCRNCSLVGLCLPQAVGKKRSVTNYLMRELRS
jgi:CRISPR-associated exonuclease Cas4